VDFPCLSPPSLSFTSNACLYNIAMWFEGSLLFHLLALQSVVVVVTASIPPIFDFPPCSICPKKGDSPANGEVVLPVNTAGILIEKATCAEVEANAMEGDYSPFACTILQQQVAEDCGCAGSAPVPTAVPATAPTAPAPAPSAPVTAPTAPVAAPTAPVAAPTAAPVPVGTTMPVAAPVATVVPTPVAVTTEMPVMVIPTAMPATVPTPTTTTEMPVSAPVDTDAPVTAPVAGTFSSCCC
jgi:hypothetical protein